ncbi:P-loop containing nucleoside triphosphate hydrolase protein, partial [Aureobasidium melanogenum]
MASASIFSFDETEPRVSSPWLKQLDSMNSTRTPSRNSNFVADCEPTAYLDEAGHITRLEAEPQKGPVEYKLHLLIRPRRNYTYMSTVTRISGSKHSKYNGPSRSTSGTPLPAKSASPSVTPNYRQDRFEHLTTQLLWRLGQSCPHHSNASTTLILPQLPESTTELQAPPKLGPIHPGLEESEGALYEIGVSDDGTLVGLAEDEMQDSLNNLRAMAASLGCIVEVQRMVKVGTCSYMAQTDGKLSAEVVEHQSDLYVAEALVKPNLTAVENGRPGADNTLEDDYPTETKSTKQLRISLTGATMSGKSSLLGTLSTSTLDDGRGKSRLSMLKHRHEITSGITSSVTQELMGYCPTSTGDVKVINYATEGVTSWIDMHTASADGRLVFVADSAGHPRYRRTTVRGLVGWKPHWVLLCVPADDEVKSSSKVAEVLGPAASDVDLSAAHLDLCLRLQLPLVVVITKYDLAQLSVLKATLGKILSVLKSAGRKPLMIPNSPGTVNEDELQSFTQKKSASIRKTIDALYDDPLSAVPIVLTSAVQGAGFDNLHAVLNELPIPGHREESSINPATTTSLFHVEDIYNKAQDANTIILSGHLSRGTISAGEELFLGPCSPSSGDDSEDSDTQQRPRLAQTLPPSRSFPGALKTHGNLNPFNKASEQEWRKVKVASIRNLRLPVSTLHSDQAGTIGIELSDDKSLDTWATIKVRRGMVLCNKPATSSSTVVAQFRRDDLGTLAVGSQVVVYLASVRSSARILSCRTPEPSELVDEDMGLGLVDQNNGSQDDEFAHRAAAGAITHEFLQVTFHFDSTKECVEVGSKILVMPGGGPGLFGGTERGEKGAAGLEGFVGRVVEVLR